MVMVDLPPPPSVVPPPPPPSQLPPPPMESEQRMIAQEPMAPVESKPDETPAGPLPAVATSLEGTGPDSFGLRKGNSFFGGVTEKTESRSSNSSRWGWYANQVQNTISQALQNNHRTRTADFRIDARIWSDRTGRITRAQIARSTGNAVLDKAIANDVLAGLILQESPPEGMPMPIVLRLTARRSQVSLSR